MPVGVADGLLTWLPLSLLDTLVGGLARLIGLPTAPDQQPPKRAIPLPPARDEQTKASEPAEPEPEPEPELAEQPEPEPEPGPEPEPEPGPEPEPEPVLAEPSVVGEDATLVEPAAIPEPEPEQPETRDSASEPEPDEPEPPAGEVEAIFTQPALVDLDAPTGAHVAALIDAAIAQLPKLELVVVVSLARGLVLGHYGLDGPVLAELGAAVHAIWSDARLLAADEASAGLAQVVLTTDDAVQVFTRLPEHDEALIVACRDPSNLGLVLARLARML